MPIVGLCTFMLTMKYFPVVLCKCKRCSVMLRAEHRMRVFHKMMLKNVIYFDVIRRKGNPGRKL